MQGYYVFVVLFISSLTPALANVDNDLEGLNIGGLDSRVGPSKLNLTARLPTHEDLEKAFADKCKKFGGEEALAKAQKAKEDAMECVKGLVDFEELQKEMEIAKPSGDLDTVFKKYCKKSPDLVACVERFTTEVEPCLEDEERQSKNIVLNVTTNLVEFICHKEGDRIALFIAEGGPECLNASDKGITNCFHKTFSKDKTGGEDKTLSFSALPIFLFHEEQCGDLSELQYCVVKELEKCKEPTPANVIDSLFSYVRKVTPCSTLDSSKRDTNGITSPYISPLPVLALTITNIFIINNFF